MHMAFLEARTSKPKTLADYKQTSFDFDFNNVHLIDPLEMHKKTGEIISSTLTNTSMNLFQMQVALSNAQSQLKMEKISSLSKDTRIKSLEDLVIKVGYDPLDTKVAEEIIKKKELDVIDLKKKLKLPIAHDPLTKEIEETESVKADMMKLIVEQSIQIKQMETEMEKMVQEKEKATQMEST